MHFSIGSYHDSADFDVMPMQACSLLLGHHWEYDIDAAHHGRTNTYSFMHKGKKIVLLPLTPSDIVKHEKEIATNANVLDPITPSDQSLGIRLKGGISLCTRPAATCTNDAPCYTMLCQHIRFAHNPVASIVPSPITNLLQDTCLASRMTLPQEGKNDEDITMRHLARGNCEDETSIGVQLKLEAQSKLSSSPSRSPGAARTKNDG